MKTRIFSQLEAIVKDRTLLLLSLMIVGLGIVYIAYVGLSIHPKDIQVVTHYSSFGVTHFYRTKWYYLLTFAVFGLVFIAAHLTLLAKLVSQGMRPLAVAYAWLSVALLIIAGVVTHSVLGLAFLQ